MSHDRGSLIKRWLDPGDCTACRSCVIACSFHHNQTFDPSIASLRIERDYQTGNVFIELYNSCDGCPGQQPLCIEFCPRDVLNLALLGIQPAAKNG